MKRWRKLLLTCLSIAMVKSWVRADSANWVPINPSFRALTQPQPAPQPPAQPEPEPPQDAFAQAPPQGPSGGGNPGGSHPHMVGDLNGGIWIRRSLLLPGLAKVQVTQIDILSLTETTQNLLVPGTVTREVNVPLAARGAFKIGENESPVPVNRFFSTYNYFNNVAVRQAVPDHINVDFNRLADQITTGRDPNGSVSLSDPSFAVTGFDATRAVRRLDLHREVVGFERLLMGDDFSVGVRLPLLQERGETTLDRSQVGDVSVIFKYALLNDADTGNVLSAGLMVTAPTGDGEVAVDGTKIHPTLLQPFVGYFVNFDNFYVQGFSSVIAPTDARDSTLLCNDVALGYRLYTDESQSGLIRYIAPTVEAHITTPLNNRDSIGCPGGFPDIFAATGAVHVGLGDRASLTAGFGTPMTGPQPFDAEAIVQFNLRF